MEIDKRLTLINIDELVAQVGVPFVDEITDAEIKECVDNRIFLTQKNVSRFFANLW